LLHALVAVLLLRAGERAALRAPTETVEIEFEVGVEGAEPDPAPAP